MASAVNFSCFDSNLSSDSFTNSVWTLNPIVKTDTASRYTQAVIITLLLLVGLPSNILVIAVILKKQLFKKQPTITLLLNLSVTDLLVCVLVLPLNIVTLIAGEFRFGGDDVTRCKVCQTGVIFVTLSMVTLNNLAILAVDRFVYIKAAIHYSKHVTHTRVVIAIIFTWLLSIIVTVPPLFGFNEMRFSTAVGICTIAFSGSTHLTKNSYYLILLAIFVLVPIVTLIITNAWGMSIIQRQLRVKSKNLKLDRGTHRKSFHRKLRRHQQVIQVKLVKIYSAIFITNLITYLPMVARIITAVVAEDEEFSEAVRITGSIAYIALLSQSVVHPIVQASLIGDVRKGITTQLGTMAQRIRKISRNETSDTTTTSSLETSLRKISGTEAFTSSLEYSHRKVSRNESEITVTKSTKGVTNSLRGAKESDVVLRGDKGKLGSGMARSVLYRGDVCCNVFCGCRCWEDIVPEEGEAQCNGTEAQCNGTL